jgi:hypothetical protein
MEEAIEQVTVKCKEFTFWHKLYADDLVVSVKYSHLEKFLTILHEVSKEFDLRVNPKRCAIFAIRGHRKISEDMNLHGIPRRTEYCYLGVILEHSVSINP